MSVEENPIRVVWWLLLIGLIMGSGACSRTWTTVDVHELRAGQQRERLFVVTTGQAYVLEDARIASDSIGGTPVTSWEFPFDPELTVRPDDTPETIAKRLRWKRDVRAEDNVEIKLSSVRHVSVYERPGSPGRLVGGIFGGLFILAIVALGVAFVTGAGGA